MLNGLYFEIYCFPVNSNFPGNLDFCIPFLLSAPTVKREEEYGEYAILELED